MAGRQTLQEGAQQQNKHTDRSTNKETLNKCKLRTNALEKATRTLRKSSRQKSSPASERKLTGDSENSSKRRNKKTLPLSKPTQALEWRGTVSNGMASPWTQSSNEGILVGPSSRLIDRPRTAMTEWGRSEQVKCNGSDEWARRCLTWFRFHKRKRPQRQKQGRNGFVGANCRLKDRRGESSPGFFGRARSESGQARADKKRRPHLATRSNPLPIGGRNDDD